MIRVVIGKDARVLVSQSGKERGRGSYICPDQSCVKAARSRGGLQRVLRTSVPESVYEEVEAMIRAEERE